MSVISPKKIDLELVREVKRGNKAAFNILVKTYQKGFYGFIFSMVKNHNLTDDIIQEAFIKAYRKISTFQEKSSFKSWLYRIGLNQAKNELKAIGSKKMVNFEEVTLKVSSKKTMEQKQMQEVIAKVIEKLPEKQKTALTLRIFENLPFKEIAEIMQCPYDTAKANFRHAINSLRKETKALSTI
jgi:RNA polymerase sigma-70 factor, ECF subfamily